MIHFNGHFDGEHICPDEPVSLPKDAPLRVTVEEVLVSSDSAASDNPAKLLDELVTECGLIDGPDDWAAEHDHYLYGTAKKSDGPTE